MRVVALHDSDEELDSLNDTGSGTVGSEVASSVPLKYEKRLQKMKDLAKQMPDSQSQSDNQYLATNLDGPNMRKPSVWGKSVLFEAYSGGQVKMSTWCQA